MVEKVILNSFQLSYDLKEISLPSFTSLKNDSSQRLLAGNGSGKTSLMFTIADIIPSDIKAKSVNLDCSVKTSESTFSIKDFKEHIAFIPQRSIYSLLGFTPLEEILISSQNIEQERTNRLIDYFEIDKLPHISSFNLSDGEKQRLIICKALNQQKKLIISDEWTTHLDSYWIDKIYKVFNDFNSDGGFHLELHSSINPIFENNFFTLNEPQNIDKTNKYIEITENLKSTLGFVSFNKTISINNKIRNYFHFKPYKIYQIIGKNGAGKTTLLKAIWKQTKKTSSIFIPADPTYHLVGPTLKDELDKIDNSKDKLFSKFLIDMFETNEKNDVFELSLGNRKLLALLLALHSDKNILLIDEPFSSLDFSNKMIVEVAIKKAINIGKSIIITGHSYNDVFSGDKIEL